MSGGECEPIQMADEIGRMKRVVEKEWRRGEIKYRGSDWVAGQRDKAKRRSSKKSSPFDEGVGQAESNEVRFDVVFSDSDSPRHPEAAPRASAFPRP